MKRWLRRLNLAPVEKLILITMAGIIVGLGWAQYSATHARHRDSQRQADLSALRAKVIAYHALYGKYPLGLADLSDLPASACRDPRGQGDCAKPDYTYEAFKGGTPVTTTTKPDCDNQTTTCDSYILYTTAMETLPNPYILSSRPY